MKSHMQWVMRRRLLLLGAFIILALAIGFHITTDLTFGGASFSIGGDADEDTTSQAGLPSNMRADVAPAVSTNILTATTILGHSAGIYLDGTAPILN